MTLALSSLLLAASASPLARRQYTAESVTISLQNRAIALESQTTFFDASHRVQKGPTGSSGPFTTINIDVAANATNQALRCQVVDEAGQPIIATRGENVDITFSDADNGEWTFADEDGVFVSAIICDPAFVAIDPVEKTVGVILQNQAIELGVRTTFEDPTVRTRLPPTGGAGPFETIEIDVGDVVLNQAIRCKVLDRNHHAIVAQRNENIDTTFSDADKGLWTFVNGATEVSAVICDPRFVAAPQQ